MLANGIIQHEFKNMKTLCWQNFHAADYRT